MTPPVVNSVPESTPELNGQQAIEAPKDLNYVPLLDDGSPDIKALLQNEKFISQLQWVAGYLADRYTQKDIRPRQALNRAILTMYANYDNKFNGLIGPTGDWIDIPLSANDFSFSVPLFKAHVDTALTSYCKTKPRFVIGSTIKSYRWTQLASMSQTLGMREYDRLMTYTTVQEEGLNLFLGGKSHRKLDKEVTNDSPQHKYSQNMGTEKTGDDVKCQNCGNEFFVPKGIEEEVTCPQCLSDNTVPVQEVYTSKQAEITYRTKRLVLNIHGPTQIQTDFSDKDGFVIRRTMMERYKANFEYKRDFKSTVGLSPEADAEYQSQREPLIEGDVLYNLMSPDGLGLEAYLKTALDLRNEVLPVVDMWFEPQDYGIVRVMGKYLWEYFPDGLYVRLVNRELVEVKHCKNKIEWGHIIAGARPNSNQGSGLMHLANLNDIINNTINLEYSILRTSGFPVTVLRSQYLQSIMPEAHNAIILDNVPETLSNEQIVSRLQPSNASGMLGIISEKLEGIMQFAGATFNFNSAAPDMKQMMNTATGASAIQEMMTDRLGLVLQRRIEADMDMIYSILEMLQQDRTPEFEAELLEEFDKDTVDLFFDCCLRHVLTMAVEKGSDSPMLESLNVYKMQTFAQLTAALTGLREFDAPTYYDLISAIGDALNLPIELGTGRKEKHYTNVQIAKIENLYKELVQQQSVAQTSPEQIALQLFSMVKQEEALIFSVVPEVELTLFDHKAMCEVCSDWIGSKAGIESPLPVKMGVIMLFGYHRDLQAQIDQAAQQQQIAMADAIQQIKASKSGKDDYESDSGGQESSPQRPGDVPQGVKRDGTTGPGRPRDVQSPEAVQRQLSGNGQPMQ